MHPPIFSTQQPLPSSLATLTSPHSKFSLSKFPQLCAPPPPLPPHLTAALAPVHYNGHGCPKATHYGVRPAPPPRTSPQVDPPMMPAPCPKHSEPTRVVMTVPAVLGASRTLRPPPPTHTREGCGAPPSSGSSTGSTHSTSRCRSGTSWPGPCTGPQVHPFPRQWRLPHGIESSRGGGGRVKGGIVRPGPGA